MRNKQPSVNPEANITTYVRKSKVTTAILGRGGWITKRIQSVKHQATFYVSI
jgi:hypothetical protein